METTSILNELQFKAIRSSGAGGQHVNKVSSKIELTFDLINSTSFTEEQKQLLIKNLTTKLTKDFRLILFCDENRSQHRNKEVVIKRFFDLIKNGLIKPKPRKATKPSKASVKKRLDGKKKHSEKKNNRKKLDL